MSMFRPLIDAFWSPDIWLPPNTQWSDLEPNDRVQYTDHRHLIYPLPMAVVVLLIRYLLEKYCFSPFGLSLGIKSTKPKKVPNNDLLEDMFARNSKWNHKEVVGLAKRLDWTERQVERWLRLRRAQDRPSTLIKFCESSWRCFYYTFSFHYGLVFLWNKPWLLNIDYCWIGYPHQGVTRDTWWYYMMSLSFYWALAVSQFFDVKRKDFWQMFVHHICTICLLSFSWICNFHRIGTLVLLTHDCGDIFLEFAKMAKYAKYQKLCDFISVVFIFVWLLTRIGLFPFWILYSTSVNAPQVVNQMFPAYYIFNGLLFLLLGLHLYWTHLILRIAYLSWNSGKMDGDIRSSSSDEITLDDDSNTKIDDINGALPNGTI
ncbi:unnamed protein product [Macrosiphum euphorbiae]|uniref:TLC domain-containing protein n=1 Tax=Macrosiphum euphorbiae TaxID=13131 RepID=A0AAV0W1C0_9HEMI|nr:unnamed protein product [Macrosiphum euphorbiae]